MRAQAFTQRNPTGEFHGMPELEGAEITFLTASGRLYGPFILHCKPFEAGAKCVLPNGTEICVTKPRDFINSAARQAFLAALARYTEYGDIPRPAARDFQATSNQFYVTVNDKPTERYGIRFPAKRERKSTFGYL